MTGKAGKWREERHRAFQKSSGQKPTGTPMCRIQHWGGIRLNFNFMLALGHWSAFYTICHLCAILTWFHHNALGMRFGTVWYRMQCQCRRPCFPSTMPIPAEQKTKQRAKRCILTTTCVYQHGSRLHAVTGFKITISIYVFSEGCRPLHAKWRNTNLIFQCLNWYSLVFS